ncbi:hypothetical protein RHGRI_010324 [Rhododendron griersonianum]|uniref:Uncharacterized protein n=1 Tax=Rhododendron griersonianum TaxID=479676 RepID=A0AAV6KI21_9ERIC|nr:hypothetical protein RHGRI_010324 [Rhododendron griersonianum]
MTGETPAIEKQSDFNLDSALQKENEAANCRSTEPEQPSCLFLDSISTLQGEEVLDVRLEFSDVIGAEILRCLFVSDLYCRKTNSQSLIACISMSS